MKWRRIRLGGENQMPYSDALAAAIIPLEMYLEEDVPVEFERDGKETGIRSFLDDVRKGVAEFHFTHEMLRMVAESETGSSAQSLRHALRAIVGDERVFEYFAGMLALDALYRVEKTKERILAVVELLPDTAPPQRSEKFLQRIVGCYLNGFDAETIVMCRAAVEVIVEEHWSQSGRTDLGEMIKVLERKSAITEEQADDMWEINRQAKEVIHDEPHRRPLDAGDCVQRISRLLVQLHPAP